MSEAKETTITFLYETLPYHTYVVNFGGNKCSIVLSAQTLLDIAAYAETNRATLEQEAKEDAGHNQYAQLEETTEIPQIQQEWRYRTSDLRM